MDQYVARQPIFDTARAVVGYELLFRAGPENVFPAETDADVASASTIAGSVLVHGFESLTLGKLAFVNVTAEVLREKHYRLLPPQRTVLELLETVVPDEHVFRACQQARDAGYRLALDDFVYRPELESLLALADIIKVDFLSTTEASRAELVARLAGHRVTLLAEKVETDAIVDEAVRGGYRYFQGYFFRRPEMVARKDVPTAKLAYLALMAEIAREPINFDRVEAAIKRDVSLSVKLLRVLNSSAFGWRHKVTSIRHALALLGEQPLRRWVALVAMVQIASDRPAEAALTCLVRARFCELLAPAARLGANALEMFFAGLLSAVDALVGRPLPEIVAELGVSTAVSRAILDGAATPLGRLLAIALAYERGDWATTAALVAEARLDEDAVPRAHREALAWAGQVMPQF